MRALTTPFPRAPRRELAEPPIETILAQVRFPTLADLYAPEGFVPFAGAIKSEYPRATPLHELGMDFSGGRVNEVNRTPVWKFEDLDRVWTLTLTPEFLALEVRRYRSFSEFKDRMTEAWEHLIKVYGVGHRTRLGLRYVDRFADEKQRDLPPDWLSLVAPRVFPLWDRDRTLRQAAQVVQTFEIPGDLSLAYRAAFKWPGEAAEGPQEFVLDLDSYDSRTRPGCEGLAERLDELKELAHNAFWWTFEELLNRTEPTHAGD